MAEYFARSVPSTVKWALAGRSRDKMEQVRKQVGRDDVGIVVASAEDAASLDEMARQARCVLTTVGPFSLYGEPLVRACARNGTDYVDTTGETTFVADMIRAYHDQARANGAIIVSMCGFDSIPADLGTYFVRLAGAQWWTRRSEVASALALTYSPLSVPFAPWRRLWTTFAACTTCRRDA